ncbi:DUF722 domain-containing protein [Streptococcus pneumoniae]|nr:DUF722 domain-containing protein [Streptococcus pneumoniae]MDS8179941.1 DUF722 domain-containing protein [Streptococcus pneumoniae]
MYELSNRDLDGIDIELGRYRTLANKIYLRRQELIHNKKHSAEDCTGGKGKTVYSPTEATIIRIEEDQTLRYLEAGATWEDVAEKLNKTTRYINSRRKVIAKRFVELKGY